MHRILFRSFGVQIANISQTFGRALELWEIIKGRRLLHSFMVAGDGHDFDDTVVIQEFDEVLTF